MSATDRLQPLSVALADRLERDGAALSEWALARMYQNPFWAERFGARGLVHSRQDGNYHMRYLVEALRGGSPATMESYARWLRTVLAARGMCTRHLDENFHWLDRALVEKGVEEAAPAHEMLAAARRALAYEVGPAARVQAAATALAERALAEVTTALGPDGAAMSDSARDRCRDDFLYHLSYLADALALGKPDTFVAYARFVAGWLPRLGVPRAHVVAALDALDVALALVDDAGARSAARVIVHAGRAAVVAAEEP